MRNKALIKIIYEVKQDGITERKVDYVQTSDFVYALNLFAANHNPMKSDVVAMVKVS